MQKKTISDLLIPTLLVVDGLICVLMAVFAYEIGVDPNITWGRTRYFLILLGTLLVFYSMFLTYFKRKYRFFELAIRSENGKTVFLVGHFWILIFVIRLVYYFWQFHYMGSFNPVLHATGRCVWQRTPLCRPVTGAGHVGGTGSLQP